jgi:hypothetical protein
LVEPLPELMLEPHEPPQGPWVHEMKASASVVSFMAR